jgi:hypothetical protein
MINSITLNFVSQYKFIKNAATIRALTTAIAIATTTFQGSGICIQVTATVINVSMKSEIATPHRNFAVEI